MNKQSKTRVHTEVLFFVTPAFASLVIFALRTMLERFVSITDITEEVYLIFACKKRCANTMHGCISPTLQVVPYEDCRNYRLSDTHLVVKPAFLVQKVKELHVRFPSPQIKVRDLEVAPDCNMAAQVH